MFHPLESLQESSLRPSGCGLVADVCISACLMRWVRPRPRALVTVGTLDLPYPAIDVVVVGGGGRATNPAKPGRGPLSPAVIAKLGGGADGFPFARPIGTRPTRRTI